MSGLTAKDILHRVEPGLFFSSLAPEKDRRMAALWGQMSTA